MLIDRRQLRKHKQKYHFYRVLSAAPIYYIVENSSVCMAETAYPVKYGWWLNELNSLGINTQKKKGLNNHKEASDLTEAVKQTLYEDYLQAYSESNR